MTTKQEMIDQIKAQIKNVETTVLNTKAMDSQRWYSIGIMMSNIAEIIIRAEKEVEPQPKTFDDGIEAAAKTVEAYDWKFHGDGSIQQNSADVWNVTVASKIRSLKEENKS